MKYIQNEYHHGIIQRMKKLPKYKDYPFRKFKETIWKLFPEYRFKNIDKDLTLILGL